MKRLLVGAICAIVGVPAIQAASLEERVSTLESQLAQEFNIQIYDITSTAAHICRTPFGFFMYSLADIKPFRSGSKVSFEVLNMQTVDFHEVEVTFYCTDNRVDFVPYPKSPFKTVKGTIPKLPAGRCITHTLVADVSPQDIGKAWGFTIDSWGAIQYNTTPNKKK